MPTGRINQGWVGAFQWGSVRFRGIKYDLALVADGFCDEFGQFKNGDILAGTDIDPIRGGLEGKQVHEGLSKVIDEEKFSAWGTGPPKAHAGGLVDFRLVEAS